MSNRLAGYRMSLDGSLIDPAGRLVETKRALEFLGWIDCDKSRKWIALIRNGIQETDKSKRQSELGNAGYKSHRKRKAHGK